MQTLLPSDITPIQYKVKLLYDFSQSAKIYMYPRIFIIVNIFVNGQVESLAADRARYIIII